MTDSKRPSARSPRASGTVTTQLVLPHDTNTFGTAFGGQIMRWMDVTAGVAAGRHCGLPCVTAGVDDLAFNRPIRMADIVVLKACVNYAGKTSMEVGVRVEREDPRSRTREHALSGYFTFVAVDTDGKPTPVPPIEASTPEEKRRYDAGFERAQRRRAAREASRQTDA